MKASALPLSPREKKLLRRMALGRRDAEIAVQIGGTKAQVSVQRLRLLKKLNIKSQAQLMDAADRLAKWPSSPIAAPPP
ncbi:MULTISPECIES: LuxR C-terminal-related transcriptional regulator [unclassified Bradyrhizobium]|uniref:LuxR C-terminal-related transcriptional regulator n=1 Tax=unclassified Bradyrhizobium TaxID=2631580 RepID=UPI000A020E24|nr:response regulator transcription factor [Bradyrhizobium sp. 6(2017)]